MNNPTCSDFSTYIKTCEWIRFATWQLERVTTTHIQGYIELNKQAPLSRMSTLFPRANFEVCRGNQRQCMDYVNKQESRIQGPWSCGIKSSQGVRTDINDIRDKVELGWTNKQLIKDNETQPIYSRMWKYIQHVRLELAEPRNFMTRIVVLWGRTGIGKSRLAHELCNPNPGLSAPNVTSS